MMLKRMMLAGLSSSLLLSAGMLVTVNAQQEPTPQQQAETATETRQGLLKVFGYNLGQISGMARGTVEFDAAIAERNALRIASMAPMLTELFAMDTREFNVETEALPIIWEQPAQFEEKVQNLIAAANTFAEVARGGDQRATLGAIRAFGGACGSCHDTFRVDND